MAELFEFSYRKSAGKKEMEMLEMEIRARRKGGEAIGWAEWL